MARWFARDYARASWRAVPLWQRLDEAGITTAGIGWPGSAPGVSWAGTHIDDTFARATGRGWDDWALPRRCAPAALREELRALRVHPTDIDGAALRPFVGDIAAVDQERDPALIHLALALAQAATVQAGATALIEQQAGEVTFVHHEWLATVRRALPAGAAPAPYVGLADAAWRFADALVGRIADLAGEDCLLLMVAPGWRGDPGIILAAGADVAVGGRIERGEAEDIAPTLLARLGLRDDTLPGRVLPPLAKVASRALPPADPPCPIAPDRTLLATVVAQGYTLRPPQKAWQARQLASLGRCLLPTAPDRAAEFARAAIAADPDNLEALLLSAAVHVAQLEAAPLPAIANTLERVAPQLSWSTLVRAGYHALRGELAAARPLLLRAEAALDADIRLRAGGAWMLLKRPTEASRAFAAALAIDPRNVAAEYGLAMSATARGKFLDAEAALRRVLAADDGDALAWKQLCDVLRKQGRTAEAKAADARLAALSKSPF